MSLRRWKNAESLTVAYASRSEHTEHLNKMSISFIPKTKREKQLLIVAGFLAAFVAVAALYMLYGGAASKVIQQRNLRRKEVAELEQIADKGPLYKRQVADYIKRSLPPAGTTTSNRYMKIILDEAKDAGFTGTNVSLTSSKSPKGSEFHTFVFKLTGEASLESLTKLIRRFNEYDLLHLIKALTIKPVEQSKRMTITMDVEAIALEQAKKKSTIDPNYHTEEAFLANLARQVKEVNDRAFFSAYRPPEPEKRPEDPGPKKPISYTEAMYTFVSAVIEVNGVSQVWIERRLKGDKLKLVVGDKLQIDGIECSVHRIELGKVTFSAMVEDEDDPNQLKEWRYAVRVGKCIDDFEEEG